MAAVLRGRPELYTSYRHDMALLNTPGKRLAVAGVLTFAVAAPFMFRDDLLFLLATGYIAGIGAIGLNLVTGYAGQVSLGHAFFLGLGAYASAVLGGAPDDRVVGLGLSMLVWLPAAGLVAAFAGLLVAPLASRLRGLYLAIVTLGLVFLGLHLFREATFITGGVGQGRSSAIPQVLGYRFDRAGVFLGIPMTDDQKMYLLMLAMLVLFALLGRNLARSDVGRAFAAVRDRDIAAEVIGVSLTRHKVLAFVVSSFYAGVAGALLYSHLGVVEPTTFDLLLSVRFLAMVLIGGVATVSGSIAGALFITLLPRITQEIPRLLPFISRRHTGGILSIFDVETILYGSLIIVFLIFEPHGLYGIWVRVRNYWKGWPFSY